MHLCFYIPILQSTTPHSCKPVIFVGNKADLEDDRFISKEEGMAVADELGGGRIKHFETSAKNNTNVTEVNIESQYYPAVYMQRIIIGYLDPLPVI